MPLWPKRKKRAKPNSQKPAKPRKQDEATDGDWVDIGDEDEDIPRNSEDYKDDPSVDNDDLELESLERMKRNLEKRIKEKRAINQRQNTADLPAPKTAEKQGQAVIGEEVKRQKANRSRKQDLCSQEDEDGHKEEAAQIPKARNPDPKGPNNDIKGIQSQMEEEKENNPDVGQPQPASRSSLKTRQLEQQQAQDEQSAKETRENRMYPMLDPLMGKEVPPAETGARPKVLKPTIQRKTETLMEVEEEVGTKTKGEGDGEQGGARDSPSISGVGHDRPEGDGRQPLYEPLANRQEKEKLGGALDPDQSDKTSSTGHDSKTPETVARTESAVASDSKVVDALSTIPSETIGSSNEDGEDQFYDANEGEIDQRKLETCEKDGNKRNFESGPAIEKRKEQESLQGSSCNLHSRTLRPLSESSGPHHDDCINITFHVVLSRAVQQIILEGGSLFVATDNTSPPWEYIVAQLLPSDKSTLANKLGYHYMSGEWKLNASQAGRTICYRYFIRDYKGVERSEHIYCPQWNAKFDRCLVVPKNSKEIEKIDDFVCREISRKKDEYRENLELVSRNRSLSSKIFLSTIDAEYLETFGVESGVRRQRAILRAHSIGGTKIVNQTKIGGLQDFNSATYSALEIEKSDFENTKRKMMSERPTFKQLAYLLIWVHLSKNVSYDSVRFLAKIFETLRSIDVPSSAVQDALSDLKWKNTLHYALVTAVNKFFYLLENSRETITNPVVWVAALPYIMEAVEKVESAEDLLGGINIQEWLNWTQRSKNSGSVIRDYLKFEEDVLKNIHMAKAILKITPNHEMEKFLTNLEDQGWMKPFPAELIFDKYIDLVSSAYNEGPIFHEGHICVFQKMRKDLTDLTVRRQELEEDPKEEKKHVLAITTKCARSYCRYEQQAEKKRVEVFGLYIDILSSFLDFELLESSDINGFLNRATGNLVESLCFGTLRQTWNRWSGLMRKRKELGPSIRRVEISLNEVIRKTDHFECLDLYMLGDNHRAEEKMIDSVLEHVTEGLIQAEKEEKANKSSWNPLNPLMKFYSKLSSSKDHRGKLSALISNYLAKTFPFQDDVGFERKLVEDLCQSSSRCKMFQLISQIKLTDFDSLTQKLLQRIDSVLSYSWKNLYCGQKPISFYQRYFPREEIWENLHMMCENTGVILGKRGRKVFERESVSNILQKIDHFQKSMRYVEDFWAILIDNQSHLVDVNSLPKAPSMASVTLERIQKNEEAFLGVTADELKLVNWYLHTYKESSVFPSFWLKNVKQLVAMGEGEDEIENSDEETFGEVQRVSWEEYKGVFAETRDRFEKFLTALDRGEVKIKEVLHYFGPLRSIEKELKFLKLEEHANKVAYLRQFQGIKKAVQLFRKVLDLLSITTNFKVITDIENSFGDQEAFQEQKLSQVSQEMISKSNIFKEWTPADLETLATFCNSRNILEWLRTHIKDGKDLKVFLDLASISAGESELEIGKLTCFQVAVNGFSSLIFDVSSGSSLESIFVAIRKVFNNAKNKDSKICKSLKDVNGMVGWINDIFERQGSVETQSLATVEQICTTGKFVITAKNLRGKRFSDFKEAMYMTYDTDTEKKKQIYYEDLEELRSKLMLITMKDNAENNVERFTHVLSQMEGVSNTLFSLLDSGCHLFSELKLAGWMELDKKVKLQVDFGHKSGVIQVNKK